MGKEYVTTPEQKLLIENLIKEFTDCGWKWNGNFPKILISDEDVDIEELKKIDVWDIDTLLGIYRPVEDSWKKEGEIVLYWKAIEAVAKIYAKENPNIEYEKSNNFLTTIVLLHEIGHWIIHWLIDRQENQFLVFANKKEVEKNFHEGLAQLLCWWSINEEQKKMFEWLNEKQSEPYKKYEIIKGHNKSHIITAIEFCRVQNVQNWDALQLIIEIINKLKFDYSSLSLAKIKEKIRGDDGIGKGIIEKLPVPKEGKLFYYVGGFDFEDWISKNIKDLKRGTIMAKKLDL